MDTYFGGLSLLWIAGWTALFFWILFVVVRAAVRRALGDHYKTVRWYEKTGEWSSYSTKQGPPRPFDE